MKPTFQRAIKMATGRQKKLLLCLLVNKDCLVDAKKQGDAAYIQRAKRMIRIAAMNYREEYKL